MPFRNCEMVAFCVVRSEDEGCRNIFAGWGLVHRAKLLTRYARTKRTLAWDENQRAMARGVIIVSFVRYYDA
jgi:hypothetical protein